MTHQQFHSSIINSATGKGVLRGTKRADQFTFDQYELLGGKTADKIIGFDSSQGDTIGVSAKVFSSLAGAGEISFASADTKTELKLLSKQDYDFVYLETNGRLFLNANGADKGWGSADKGGLIAILKGKPELSAEVFTILA